ncbi:LysR family transcriptional regulator [Novosphingobium resinovorum]|uniref:LysR family transcriptional regulator n=1 Tax=Novosphingobium resinovorum TaxID=158500 RepID=UPI002ED68421|nr:LysR family transcriptional regulator [Novosphingobium resinovorum]
MPPVDLNLLVILHHLLQVGSVSLVARRLGVSQPTVSRSLARLREAFDDPLFIRTNKGLQLTQRAEDLMEPLGEWLGKADLLFLPRRFDPSLLERQFRIAATDSGFTAVLAPAFARIRDEAPGVSIVVQHYCELEASALASGRSDFVISGYRPDDSMTYSRRLAAETSVCVMRAGHPLGGAAGAIPLDRYLDYPHVALTVGDGAADPIAHLLGKHAAARRVIASVPYFHAAHALLEATDAIATVPGRVAAAMVADPRWTARPAPAEIPPYAYWLLWHERIRRDPSTEWFVDLIAAVCNPALNLSTP